MVVFPAPTAVATPALLTVATNVLLDDQDTSDDILAVRVNPPPVYVPVATNCCIAPFVMVEVVGVTAIEVSVKHCGQEATLKKNSNAA